MISHLLEEFDLLVQEMVLQEVTEMRVCVGRTQKGQIQVVLQAQGDFHGILALAPLILGWFLHILEEGAAAVLVSYLQKRLDALTLFLHQLAGEVARVLQSHIIMVKTVTQREVGVGGPQVRTDRAVGGWLHLGGIILMKLGGHGWLAIKDVGDSGEMADNLS